MKIKLNFSYLLLLLTMLYWLHTGILDVGGAVAAASAAILKVSKNKFNFNNIPSAYRLCSFKIANTMEIKKYMAFGTLLHYGICFSL